MQQRLETPRNVRQLLRIVAIAVTIKVDPQPSFFGFPLFGGGYWGVIATRACVYWVLVSGLNLVVGFGGQIAIGWVALLTLGAYTTSVLVAGNVTPAQHTAAKLRMDAEGPMPRRRR